MNNIITIVSVLSTVTVTTITVVWYLRELLKNNYNKNFERANNYINFFVPQYSDGIIVVSGRNDTLGYFSVVNNEKSFKEFRLEMDNLLKEKQDIFMTNEYKNELCRPNSVLNACVFKIGVNLNRIGSLCALDVFDMQMIMNLHAPQIIYDWACGYVLLKDKIGQNKSGFYLPDNRKYFNWLTSVAVLFIAKKYHKNSDKIRDILRNYENTSGKYVCNIIDESILYCMELRTELKISNFSSNKKFIDELIVFNKKIRKNITTAST